MHATRILGVGLSLLVGLTLGCVAGGGGGGGADGGRLDGSAGAGGVGGGSGGGGVVDSPVPGDTPVTALDDESQRLVCEAQAAIIIDVMGARDYCEFLILNILAQTADARPEPPTAADCEGAVAECVDTLDESLPDLLCRGPLTSGDLSAGCEQVTVDAYLTCLRAQTSQLEAAFGDETCAGLDGFDERFDAAMAMDPPPECAAVEELCPALAGDDEGL